MIFEYPMSFLDAVARQEGYYLEASRAFHNKNPGDIEWGKFAQAHGATHGDPRFAVFPDASTGFAAMKALFQADEYKNLTVRQALNKWAPPVENQTNVYITNVCKWVGCTPNEPIWPLLEPLENLASLDTPSDSGPLSPPSVEEL